ncbi:MAG: glycerophosphodiester phosphodiesterase family protein, partial [Verrucomicrobia bacterium]|nr:glycerophosphodiester phosphodiesterase family protein [Verrucomicrobiota bacterium]
MKRKDLKQTLSLIVAGVMVTCVANGATGNHVDKIIAELKNSRSDQILVVAHRGDWRNHPENSIKALEGCIEMGVDIVEFDVRRTRDGIFVLMHDSTVDRTSNGSGNIADMTFKEVRKLRLKHKGKVTDQHVPSLEEILDVAKGEI